MTVKGPFLFRGSGGLESYFAPVPLIDDTEHELDSSQALALPFQFVLEPDEVSCGGMRQVQDQDLILSFELDAQLGATLRMIAVSAEPSLCRLFPIIGSTGKHAILEEFADTSGGSQASLE
jgi:hypothetical protein